jgi:3',5'-cyclic AMP phosphodiesterase CpdA
VIDSTLIQVPAAALKDYEQQNSWLKAELEKAKASGAKHIIVFEHHPLFLKDAQEPNQYFTIPLERRRQLLDLFHKYGVRYVFAGHLHMNNLVSDGQLEMVTTGPVGKPLGKDGSGIRIAAVTDTGVEHRYYEFGMLPERLTVDPVTPPTLPPLPVPKEHGLAATIFSRGIQ